VKLINLSAEPLGKCRGPFACEHETFAMLRNDEYLRVAANVGTHVILGLALVWLGYALTSR